MSIQLNGLRLPLALVVTLLFAVAGWFANDHFDLKQRVTKLEEHIDDRYRGTDAARDFKLRDERLVRLQEQLDDLRQKHR